MEMTEALIRATILVAGALAASAALMVYVRVAVDRDWSMFATFSPLIAIMWAALFLTFWMGAS